MPAAVAGPKKGYPRYEVPPAVYNGTLDNGTRFSDACATADPVYPRMTVPHDRPYNYNADIAVLSDKEETAAQAACDAAAERQITGVVTAISRNVLVVLSLPSIYAIFGTISAVYALLRAANFCASTARCTSTHPQLTASTGRKATPWITSVLSLISRAGNYLSRQRADQGRRERGNNRVCRWGLVRL
jgi:hypothetical protein